MAVLAWPGLFSALGGAWAMEAPVVGATLVAVIDRSSEAGSGLNEDQRSILSQAARGQLVRSLAHRGCVVLSEENTIAILRDMGVDLATCEGECELQVARTLQADWLVSIRLVRLGGEWTVQANLFRTSSGAMVGGETRECGSERELRPALQHLIRDLCHSQFPEAGGDRVGVAAEPPATSPPREAEGVVLRDREPKPVPPATGWEERRSGIRNRFCLEGGWGPCFFYPRQEGTVRRSVMAWGADLRYADRSASLYDLVLSWWRATEDFDDHPEAKTHYALLRAVVEITPFHLGPVHAFGRAGYQVIQTRDKWDERLLLGGPGLEYRARGGLALAAGMDFLKEHRLSDGRFSEVTRHYRAECSWSGANLGLGLEALFGGEAKAEESITARLLIY
jgi:hypothetical protein